MKCEELLKMLKDDVSNIIQVTKTTPKRITFYTASPWNSYKEFLFVKDYSRKKEVGFAVSIFADFKLFDVNDVFKKKIDVLQGYDLKIETDPYILCYPDWLEGHSRVPCQSPLCRIVVYPDGDVPFCCHKDLILGNLYQQSLDEIWNSAETKRIQNQFIGSCNDCWISFHRKFDLSYFETLDRGLPKLLAKKLGSNYTFERA